MRVFGHDRESRVEERDLLRQLFSRIILGEERRVERSQTFAEIGSVRCIFTRFFPPFFLVKTVFPCNTKSLRTGASLLTDSFPSLKEMAIDEGRPQMSGFDDLFRFPGFFGRRDPLLRPFSPLRRRPHRSSFARDFSPPRLLQGRRSRGGSFCRKHFLLPPPWRNHPSPKMSRFPRVFVAGERGLPSYFTPR